MSPAGILVHAKEDDVQALREQVRILDARVHELLAQIEIGNAARREAEERPNLKLPIPRAIRDMGRPR
jgi:hypothetical protein